MLLSHLSKPKEANGDKHWRALASNMVLRPLHVDTQARAFAELSSSTPSRAAGAAGMKGAMKTEVLKLYYPVFQVRRRVRAMWRDIEALWEEMLPEALLSLLPGAGEEDLERFEEQLGCLLPEDLAESLRVHEGMRESGQRKGQLLLELERDDPHSFATVRLRPLQQMTDLVRAARLEADARFPEDVRPRDAAHSILYQSHNELPLMAVAFMVDRRARFTRPPSPWLPLFASDCLSVRRLPRADARSQNVLLAFPHHGRMTVLEALDSPDKLEDLVHPPGAVGYLRIAGFCGPTWYAHANCFEQYLGDGLEMLRTVQHAWSLPCSGCSPDWPGWHCPKCKRVVGESLADALERALPASSREYYFDQDSWWAAGLRSYGWDRPYFKARRLGSKAPFMQSP